MMNYIKNEDSLKKICNILSQGPYIAIDTEFVSDGYYYPRLGIIQIAGNGICAIIDPLYIEDMTNLFTLMTNPSITKIFHSGKEDISIFYEKMKEVPKPIFDTQLAAGFSGYEEQASYAKLVYEITGVRLKKFETTTDWLQRPLTDNQIKYAIDDVKYLPEIYLFLKNYLEKWGRYSWVEEEFKYLEDEENYKPKGAEGYYNRISSLKLNTGQKNNLLELFMWRDNKAREHNKTKKYILKDDVLMSIAKMSPKNIQELQSIPGLFPKNLEKYGREILDIINNKKKKKTKFPQKHIYYDPPPGLVNLLNAYIKKRSAELNIASSLISTRDDMEELIYNTLYDKNKNSKLLRGWRGKMVGEYMIKIIKGELSLKFSTKENQVILF